MNQKKQQQKNSNARLAFFLFTSQSTARTPVITLMNYLLFLYYKDIYLNCKNNEDNKFIPATTATKLTTHT